MKICARCQMQLHDNATTCNRCGYNRFNYPNINSNNGANPNINRPNINRPVQPNYNGQQQPINRMPNGQQPVRPQVTNQPAYQNQNMQPNGFNNQQIQNNPQEQFIDYANQGTVRKSWKEKRAEKKAQEQEIMSQVRGAGNCTTQNQNSNNPQMHNGNQMDFFEGTQFNANVTSDMSIKDWIIQILLTAIPIVNIIVLIKGMNNLSYSEYRRNFCKAFLIYYIGATIISLGLSFLLTFIGIL